LNQDKNHKAAQSPVQKRLAALWTDSRSFKKRLLIAAPVFLAACFTFLFYGPLEMVAFSGNSLVYSYKEVIWPLAALAAAVCLAGVLITMLFRGKVFNYVVCTVFVLTVCGYLQAAFLNGNLGTLTGDAIAWQTLKESMLLNLAVWVVALLCGFLLLYLDRALWTKLMTFVCCALVFMQTVPLLGIVFGAYDETEIEEISSYSLSEEGMYAFSEKDNIFIFVLDRLDYDYIEAVRKQDPDFFDALEGFTDYTNAISCYARTMPALANLVTGYTETAYTATTQTYYTQAWIQEGRDLLADLNGAEYTAEFYTSIHYLFADPEYAKAHVANLNDGKGDLAYATVLKKLMYLSAYRYVPTAMKPFYWEDTNYYNEDVLKNEEYEAYQFDDSGYGPGFLEATADRQKGSFKLYHFYGPHSPYTMHADGTASEEPTTVQEQTMGCFNILYRAFERMKELGIYDDATIIITGDHGAAISDTKGLQKATRVGLFYKPAGKGTQPLEQSAAPVSSLNIAATVAKAAGVDHTAYGPALDEIGENDQIVRYYYKSLCPSGSYGENMVYQYQIVGDAADMDNWELIGQFPVEAGNNFY